MSLIEDFFRKGGINAPANLTPIAPAPVNDLASAQSRVLDTPLKQRLANLPETSMAPGGGDALRNAPADSGLANRLPPPAPAPQPGEQMRSAATDNDAMRQRLQATQGPQPGQTRADLRTMAPDDGLKQRLQATQGPQPAPRSAPTGADLASYNPDDGMKARLQATQGPQPQPQASSPAPQPAPAAAQVRPGAPVYVNGAGEATGSVRDRMTMLGQDTPADKAVLRQRLAAPSSIAAAGEQATVARNKFPSAPANNPISNPNVSPSGVSAERMAFNEAGAGRALPAQVGGQPAPQAQSMATRLRGLFGLGEQAAAGAPATAPAAAAGEAAAARAVPTARAGIAAEAGLLGKAEYGAGRLIGTAARIGKGFGPAALGVDAITHFNDYKLNDPGVDSSVGGTWDALKKGDLAGVGNSLAKGAKETAMDLGSTMANLADYVVPGKAPVSREYDKMLHDKFGDRLAPNPAVTSAIAKAAAPVTMPAAAPASVATTKTAAKEAPAAPPAAAAAPVAAPAAPVDNRTTIADAARQNALSKLDLETENDPNAIVAAGRVAGRAPAEYYTADGRVIVPTAPATEADRQLSQRVSVTEANGAPGTSFEKDGRQYINVQHGLDATGKPVYKALSVDGQASHYGASATDLLNQYDAAQHRLGGLAPEDALSVANYHDREQRRRGIEAQYGAPAPAAPGAAPAPAAAPAAPLTPEHQKVAAFSAQYGGAAAKAAATLGVDPSLVLAQWGLETGWGKSVIPGTNNLGNIKAVNGQGGVAATDNATKSKDKYAKFGSADEFADRYAGLLGQPRYQNVAGSGNDVGRFADALHTGGYAQDPQYVEKMKGAHATLLAATGGARAPAAPAAAAAAAAPADPFGGAVQVVQHGQSTMHVPGSVGMSEIPQAAFDAYRGAFANQPELARRMTMGAGGPLIDGVAVPPDVVAGGGGKVDAYLANLNEGQNYQNNATAGKIAEEKEKGKIAAEAQRLHRTPQPGEIINNPEEVGVDLMGQPIIKNVPYVRQPDGSVKRAIGEAAPHAALPPGMKKQVGTAGGKPVYVDAHGKKFIGD